MRKTAIITLTLVAAAAAAAASPSDRGAIAARDPWRDAAGDDGDPFERRAATANRQPEPSSLGEGADVGASEEFNARRVYTPGARTEAAPPTGGETKAWGKTLFDDWQYLLAAVIIGLLALGWYIVGRTAREKIR